MDYRMARHLVNILIESPLYLGLTVKERRRLIAEFATRYLLAPDNRSDRESTEEPLANAK
jgi:hypothetical protein